MNNKAITIYAKETEEEARVAMWAELRNWIWIDQAARERIAAKAIVEESESRFGPIFSITFPKEATEPRQETR